MRYFNIQWHITDKCQNNCVHCYRGGEIRNELTTEQIFKVVDDIKDLTMVLQLKDGQPVQPMINFTGGDPLLRKDFFKILEQCKDITFDISGNPDLVTKEIANKFRDLGISNYGISIDGLEETHNKRRGKGKYKIALEAIKILREAGVSVIVMSSLDEDNRNEFIPLMKELSGKVEKIMFTRNVKLGNCQKDISLTPLKYKEFLKKILQNIPDDMRLLTKEDLWQPLFNEMGLLDKEVGRTAMCMVGRNWLCIIPDGTVYPCRKIPVKIGKVPEEKLWDILISDKMNYFRQDKKFEKCNNCQLKEICRGCPCIPFAETGNFYGKDPQCWKQEIQ